MLAGGFVTDLGSTRLALSASGVVGPVLARAEPEFRAPAAVLFRGSRQLSISHSTPVTGYMHHGFVNRKSSTHT